MKKVMQPDAVILRAIRTWRLGCLRGGGALYATLHAKSAHIDTQQRIIETYSSAARIILARMLFRMQMETWKRHAFAVWQWGGSDDMDAAPLDEQGMLHPEWSRPREVTKERNPLLWAQREVEGANDRLFEMATELEEARQATQQEMELLAGLLSEKQQEVEAACGQAVRGMP